jgi:hypothetical protein
MALRGFIDKSGVAWEVWEVHSTMTERRKVAERRAAMRATAPRRVVATPRISFGQGFEHGWLAFRSTVERRRRSVIPERWEELSNDGLCSLLSDSRATGPVRRRVD